MAIIMFSL